jgi:hypothetical protein
MPNPWFILLLLVPVLILAMIGSYVSSCKHDPKKKIIMSAVDWVMAHGDKEEREAWLRVINPFYVYNNDDLNIIERVIRRAPADVAANIRATLYMYGV